MSPKVLIEKSKGSKGKGLAIRGRAHPYVLPSKGSKGKALAICHRAHPPYVLPAGQRHYRGQPLTSKTGKTGRHPQPEDPNDTINENHFHGSTMFAHALGFKITGGIFNNISYGFSTITIIDPTGRRIPFPPEIQPNQKSIGDYLKLLFQYPREDRDRKISGMLLEFVQQ
ncbi:hypothetical protein Moror_558, partial [Moniliophthora roreri MCA 2997]